MAPKRRRIQLPFEKKYEIIQMIDTGAPEKIIAKMYGIKQGTVSTIRSRREKIIKFVNTNSTTTDSCTILLEVGGSVANFHKALRQWYAQCKEKNIKVTNAMLKNIARQLNAQFCANHSFKGSLRWVARFKKHPDFRKGDISENFGNQYEADILKAQIRKLLQDGEYTLDNVYNADSIALMWKSVPERTLLFNKSESSSRINEEQIIIILCSNATGCHKTRVLILKATDNSPSSSSSHKSVPSSMNNIIANPLMNKDVFTQWFNECFLESVTERQEKNGRREKTLLLLHNGGSNHESKIISTKDEFVKIMYFSYDIAPLVQPMDHGIIACFRRMYRNELLEILIPPYNSVSEEDVIRAYSQLDITHYCHMIKNAWSKVKNPILQNAWDKLLKDESRHSQEECEIIRKDIIEALEKLNKIPGCGECDSIAVMNWFEADKEHHTDTLVDIQDTLLDFINTVMDVDENEFPYENFESILEDSSSQKA